MLCRDSVSCAEKKSSQCKKYRFGSHRSRSQPLGRSGWGTGATRLGSSWGSGDCCTLAMPMRRRTTVTTRSQCDAGTHVRRCERKVEGAKDPLPAASCQRRPFTRLPTLDRTSAALFRHFGSPLFTGFTLHPPDAIAFPIGQSRTAEFGFGRAKRSSLSLHQPNDCAVSRGAHTLTHASVMHKRMRGRCGE